MTTEERTPTTEERLEALECTLDNVGEVHAEAINDISARLMKLEALLGDRHVIAALERMSFDGRMREYIAEEIAKRKDEPLPAGMPPPPRYDPNLTADDSPPIPF